MTIGIYKLNFSNTDKVYIGQSLNIEGRLRAHTSLLRNNKHCMKLQKAYQEFGMPSLEVICECREDELDELENLGIELWDAVNNGFNFNHYANEAPVKYGEDSGNSKYSNEQIIDVFYLLIDNNFSQRDISIITGVSRAVVNSISSLARHTWLKAKFPKEYLILEALLSNRCRTGDSASNSKYSNEKIVEVFNLLIDFPNLLYKDIESKTGVSKEVITAISCLTRHAWLKDKFPEKYKKLEALKGKRYKTKNASERGIKYPLVQSPDGECFEILCLKDFSDKHNLNRGHLCEVLHSKRKTHKGWKLAQT